MDLIPPLRTVFPSIESRPVLPQDFNALYSSLPIQPHKNPVPICSQPYCAYKDIVYGLTAGQIYYLPPQTRLHFLVPLLGRGVARLSWMMCDVLEMKPTSCCVRRLQSGLITVATLKTLEHNAHLVSKHLHAMLLQSQYEGRNINVEVPFALIMKAPLLNPLN